MASDYIVQFSQWNEKLKGKYAVIARGEVWAMQDGNESTRDAIIIEQRDTPKQTRYYAHASGRKQGGMLTRVWSQQYEKSGRTFARFGDGSQADWLRHDDVTVEGATETVKFQGVAVDLIQAVIAPAGAASSSLVDANWAASIFLAQGELVDSWKDDRGRIVGVWTIGGRGGSYAEILFQRNNPHLPIRSTWFLKDHRNPSKPHKELDVAAVTTVEWKKIASNVWVPSRWKNADFIPHNGLPLSELDMELRWIIGEKATIPVPTKKQLLDFRVNPYDWRQGIKELFDEDWSLSFDQRSGKAKQRSR